MLMDIRKCSIQYLKTIFLPLDGFNDCVFWIRNADMSKQIFSSTNYKTIWQRDESIVYELPLIWLDYLAAENKNNYMFQLQQRHISNYLNYKDNLVLYQVALPDGRLQYLRDRAFKCIDANQQNYVVGVSHKISNEMWCDEFIKRKQEIHTHEVIPLKLFFKIIKQYFGMLVLEQVSAPPDFFKEFKIYINQSQQLNLSKREIECIYYLRLGKTYKQVARELSISPRTIETHVENILRKTECKKIVEVISKYSNSILLNNP